ncbi:hypothetical protein [Nonomuraea sp. CA-141351]
MWGMPLDPRNFYRKIKKTHDFIVPVGSARKAATDCRTQTVAC